MPPRKKKAEDREIEALKARRRKAQEKNDIAEEARLCNAIGAIYTKKGSYEQALCYHRTELHLSEATGDGLDTAVAHRRVGECLSELGDYEQAIQHQRQYLKMARDIGSLVEEQRALATLGRTYFIQSQSGDVGREEARELRVQAGNANLKSLDVCDKLSGVYSDRELLEMRSRLYLNLGLIYENSGDLSSARKFMEKALSIARELEDSATILRCHHVLGSLYLRERRPALALRCFRDALGVASEQHNWQLEVEVLREMSQAQLLMSNFDEAKSCLKKVVRLLQENSQLAETEADQRKLNTVRKVVHYSLEMEALGVERAEKKMEMCERLGDLCCSLRAFPAAIKFYEQQCDLAEAHGAEPKDLSVIYISLARTHTDCHQYSEALLYYDRELRLGRRNASEDSNTWLSVGKVRHSAGFEKQVVLEAFEEAYKCAGESKDPQVKIDVCRAVLRFCKRHEVISGQELEKWEGEVERVLACHPDLPVDSSGDSDSDNDTQDVEGGLVTPDTLSEMETVDEEEEEEEEEEMEAVEITSSRRGRGVAARRKARLSKRNEKGETLLHLAAISGNLTAARQLILQGADVNVRDNCGWSPLHEASNHGQIEVVACLLDNGAEVDDPGGERCGGVTPLMDSANNGHLDVVKLLVQRGANVLQKDAKGDTAVDMLTERLSTAAESSDPYDLEEEHTAIRDYLVGEMRKRGWNGEAPVIRERNDVRGRRSASSSSSREDVSGGDSCGRRVQRRGFRMTDRTGRSVLLSDEEEEGFDGIQIVSSAPKSPPRQGGWSSHNEAASVKAISSRTLSTSRSLMGNKTSRDSTSKPRQLKRPFIHEDTPSPLIPNDRAESSLMTGAYPIIDHWLEDDVGRPQLKKRKSRDPFTSHSQSSSGTKRTLSLRAAGGTSRSRERVLCSSISSVERSSRARGGSTGSVRDGGDLSGDVVTIDSSPESNTVTSHTTGTSHRIPQSSTPLHSATPKHSATPSTQPPPPSPLPLRIRVKIETKSYLVPCPVKLPDGSHSTVQWLAAQAAERYYSQHGVRPRLSLATSDGALLSGEDVVVHVLQSGEEVEGQVDHWHLPPLPERYQTACSSSGLECHKKVLELFQSPSGVSVLDLSHSSLRPTHLPPLLSSLRGHAPLTSLSLCGNRLKPEGMPLLASCLSRHPNLRVLDLSCTGLTLQGLESLSNPSSSPSLTPHPHPATTSTKPWSSLRALLLGYNSLGPDCGPALSSLLSLTSRLQELQLQSCQLEGRTLERHTSLSHTLRGLGDLAEVVVSLNPLGPRGVTSLVQSLPTAHLSRLDLANTSTTLPLTDTLDEPKVAEFFGQVSGRLEWLSLSHCPLDVESLARLLENCRHLRELRLAAVGLSSHSTPHLSRLVQCCTCLKLLDVSGNKDLGNEGCLQLLACCKSVGRDIRIDVRSCGMTSPLPSELRQTLSDLIAKKKVEISGNRIDSTEYALLFPS